MSCAMCVRHVTKALQEVPGVEPKNVAVGSAEVEYDPAVTPEERILDAIRLAGYPARIAG
jgi:copper chaperone CopZ